MKRKNNKSRFCANSGCWNNDGCYCKELVFEEKGKKIVLGPNNCGDWEGPEIV